MPQNGLLPCQDKSKAVEVTENILGAIGLIGDVAQVVGTYTGIAPLAAAGTALEVTSIGGSAALHLATGDYRSLTVDAASLGAAFIPGGTVLRKVGGAAGDWGRRANGTFKVAKAAKRKAQDKAAAAVQSKIVGGGSICPVKSG